MIEQFWLLMLCVVSSVFGYNLSPIPSYIITAPTSHHGKTDTSYFGYAITLRTTSILIGAPQASSNLETQHDILKPGSVYKCRLDKSPQPCVPFILDPLGNINQRNMDKNIFTTVNKDEQWLGATMDGLALDSDRFVTCAPKICTVTDPDISGIVSYYFHGVCYTTPNTSSIEPFHVFTVDTPRLRKVAGKFYQNTGRPYEIRQAMMSQLGFSVYICDDSNVILFGAPGFSEWRGTVYVYHHIEEKLPNLNKRSVNNNPTRRVKRSSLFRDEITSNDPYNWNEEEYSYFGYSVSSAYFRSNKSELMYVASAPRANNSLGKVIIFNYKKTQYKLYSDFEEHLTFYGTQMGEYFGYALLTDDFNGDGLTDIAISAPFFKAYKYNDGCVYVYLNKGEMNFEIPMRLYGSPNNNETSHGQFGMTLGKIGDINGDGYSDMAVAAPFEDNRGAVYIYYGSKNGIKSQYIQKILPKDTNQLFGMGLSRGVDIDDNGFTDIAIGAPNANIVYIYLAYPSIKVIARISGIPPAIPLTATTSQIEVCMAYRSQRNLTFAVDTMYAIKMDSQLKRAKFSKTASQYNDTFALTPNFQCKILNITVNSQEIDINYPVKLELNYKLIKNFTHYTEFCTDCAVLNPDDKHSIENSIPFVTGCNGTGQCVANLNVKATVQGLDSFQYVLDSSATLTVEYVIQNTGETAYLPRMSIIISELATLQLPPFCQYINLTMIDCSLNYSRPLVSNSTTNFNITINTKKMVPGKFILLANATSFHQEETREDNFLATEILCREVSEMEIIGTSSIIDNEISVEKAGRVDYPITYSYELRNNGPSKIRDMQFGVAIPTKFYNLNNKQLIHLIDPKKIQVTGKYAGEKLEVMWEKKLLTTNNKMYTEGVDYKAAISILNSLPTNRSIYFNCTNEGLENGNECVLVLLRIKQFIKENRIVSVTIKYNINLAEVDQLYSNIRDMFILVFKSGIYIPNDNTEFSVKITAKEPFTIIAKHSKETPLWIIIVSTLAGFILFCALTYLLYRMGFFKRAKKEELEFYKLQENIVKEVIEENKILESELEVAIENESQELDSFDHNNKENISTIL